MNYILKSAVPNPHVSPSVISSGTASGSDKFLAVNTIITTGIDTQKYKGFDKVECIICTFSLNVSTNDILTGILPLAETYVLNTYPNY
jgi:hypothetical protein